MLRYFSSLDKVTSQSIKDATKALPFTISQILAHPTRTESKLLISGWIRSIRIHKNVAFVMINDGSRFENLQINVPPDMAKSLEVGSSVRFSGILKPKESNNKLYELRAESITVLGHCDPKRYPAHDAGSSVSHLRRFPHLRIRSRMFSDVMHLRGVLIDAFRVALKNHAFLEIHPPAIVFSDCEGAGETFEIKDQNELFHNKSARLSVSAQFYAEAAALALGRVFSFGPIFRAEKHDTSRHLNEFWMLEVEIPFLEDLETLMNFLEQMIVEVTDYICSSFDILPLVSQERISIVSTKGFARISYGDAIQVLKSAYTTGAVFEDINWGMPLRADHEKFLAEQYFKSPVFVYNYPAPIKPFYMRSNGDSHNEVLWRSSTVANFDLLFPEVAELAGGGLRVDQLDALRRQMQYHRISDGDQYGWYEDLRKYGSAPHGGFGIGFDRLVQYLCGLKNIKEAIFIPRYPGTPSC